MYELLPDGTKVDIPVDDGKALSCLCKILLSKDSYLSVNYVASALGISPQSFRNKLTRNSFSVNDLLVIADMSGASIKIHTAHDSIIQLELKDFLKEDSYNKYQEYLQSSKHMTIEEIKKLSKSLTVDEINNLISDLKNDTDPQNT